MEKSKIAYGKIRKMLISGQFSQEKTWSLRKLAKKFDMSVVPVSEAVRRLEQEGLVAAYPQRGISVARLSSNQIKQANVIREALEIQAARIVAKKNSKQVLDKLMTMARKMHQLIEKEKLGEAAYMDFQIHEYLVKAASCKMLTEKYNQLATMCMLTQGSWQMDHFQNDPLKSNGHIILIEAISSGSAAKAEKAIRKHIQSTAS